MILTLTEKEILEKLLKSTDILIEEKLKSLKFNYYIEGKIVSINEDGKYTVRINGEDETLSARSGLTLLVGEVVLVCVPNGNESFKFIDLKRPYQLLGV